jgi:YggT family protein
LQILGEILYGVIWAFIALLWIRFVVDWVQVFARQWTPRGPLLVALEVVYSVTDPPIKAVGRVLPPLRIGSISLDLAFMVVFFVTYVLMQVASTL